jgi:hypothetical protein
VCRLSATLPSRRSRSSMYVLVQKRPAGRCPPEVTKPRSPLRAVGCTLTREGIHAVRAWRVVNVYGSDVHDGLSQVEAQWVERSATGGRWVGAETAVRSTIGRAKVEAHEDSMAAGPDGAVFHGAVRGYGASYLSMRSAQQRLSPALGICLCSFIALPSGL